MLLEVARVAGARRDGLRLNGAALGLLLQELSALLEAGLVLIEALEARDKAGQAIGRCKGVGTIAADPIPGATVVAGDAGAAGGVPELLVATVASSEGSGQLPAALKRYQYYEQRVATLRKRVTGALVYPAVVLSVGGGILLFMLFFVIPASPWCSNRCANCRPPRPPCCGGRGWQSHGGLLGAGWPEACSRWRRRCARAGPSRAAGAVVDAARCAMSPNCSCWRASTAAPAC